MRNELRSLLGAAEACCSISDVGRKSSREATGRDQGTAIGVDIYSWPGADVVSDTTGLPFPEEVFRHHDHVACLNHVPQSKRSLDTAYRSGEAAARSAFPLHGGINARHGAPIRSWHFRHTRH